MTLTTKCESDRLPNHRVSDAGCSVWGIVTGDFVTTGGMDSANYHLARCLAGTGAVELVSHRFDTTLASIDSIGTTTVSRPFGAHFLGANRLRREGRRLAERVRSRGGRFVANGGNCDAGDINWVHYVHAAYEPQQAASVARRAKNVWHRRRCLRSERESISRAEAVITNSELTASHVTTLLGVSPERVKTVYYGSDPERFAPVNEANRVDARDELGADGRPWLVFIGALGDRRKGFDTLYDAWRGLAKDRNWDALLVVVGQGAEAPLWKQRADADGLSASMRFMGFRDDVPRILTAAHGLVHPARYEAYGLGVHEAVCVGLPAIVTANCGVAERLRMPDGSSAIDELILPRPGDPAALAEAIRYWRAELANWPQRVRPISDRLRSYTWEAMAGDFVTAVQPAGGGAA